MSHQIRDVSPLNSSSNLNSRQTKPPIPGQNNSVAQSRGGSSANNQSGYVPYEPKKRDMTQKIAPKMPMPMSQDLTNLPLPHNHVGDKQQNQASKAQSQANSKMLERPKGSSQGNQSSGTGQSHHASSHPSRGNNSTSMGGPQRMVSS